MGTTLFVVVDDPPPVIDNDDEFVLFCCANTKIELVFFIDANLIPSKRIAIDNLIITFFIESIIIKNTTMVFNAYSFKDVILKQLGV